MDTDEPTKEEGPSADKPSDVNTRENATDPTVDTVVISDNNDQDAVQTMADQSDSTIAVDEEEKDISKLSAEQLQKLCLKKDQHIKQLQELLESEKQTNSKLREMYEVQRNLENKLKQQQLESSRKENILIMRLTLKEQELQDCLTQIEALRQLRQPTSTQLESYLLDPALNYMFEQMKKEVDVAKARVEEMQSELNAWKFTTDSVTGKRLMSKCRQLHQENEELGKMISSGKIAKLEGGLAMSKKYSEELKKSQSEIEEFLMEMEEDIEGFQNTVYYLQQQLKEQKERNTELEESLAQMKNNVDSAQVAMESMPPVASGPPDNDNEQSSRVPVSE